MHLDFIHNLFISINLSTVTDPGIPIGGANPRMGANLILPSATKLARLWFYKCLSVHRVGWGWGSAPGGCLVLWGVPGPGGCPVLGVPGIPACTEAGTPERRLLLRTVRILLECILVNGSNRLLLSRCSYLFGYTAF